MTAFVVGFVVSIITIASFSAMFFFLQKAHLSGPTFMHVLGMIAGAAAGIAFILLPVLNWITKQAQP